MAIKTRENLFKAATPASTPPSCIPPAAWFRRSPAWPIPRNKAIVGENAFAHESGIHQHGMLRNSSTYEIMRPQDVGLSRTNLVLGKHSGRHAFRERVKELGFEPSMSRVQSRCSRSSRRWPTRRRNCSTATSKRWSCRQRPDAPGPWQLVAVQVSTAPGERRCRQSSSSTRWSCSRAQSMTADGPVDASHQGHRSSDTGARGAGRSSKCAAYPLGEDAQGEALITWITTVAAIAASGCQHQHRRSRRTGLPRSGQSHRNHAQQRRASQRAIAPASLTRCHAI